MGAFEATEETGDKWDTFRDFLHGIKESTNMTSTDYWKLIDLVQEYGFAMRQEGYDQK